MAQSQSAYSFQRGHLDTRGTKSFRPVSLDEILKILVHSDNSRDLRGHPPRDSRRNKLLESKDSLEKLMSLPRKFLF